MAGKVDKSDLGYLGIDFQKKLVKCFVEYPNFFNEIPHEQSLYVKKGKKFLQKDAEEKKDKLEE